MNVLVLMGGNSAEREISLKTGAGIVAALTQRGHRVLAGDPGTGRLVSAEHLALAGGEGGAVSDLPAGSTGNAGNKSSAGNKGAGEGAGTAGGGSHPQRMLAEHTQALIGAAAAAAATDVVFIALHGGAGEDGRLQALLELAGKAYTGSGPLASGLAMDKVMAKRLFAWAGVPTPEWVDLPVVEARALCGALGFAGAVGAGAGGTRAGAAGARAAGAGAAPAALAELGGLPIVVKPVDQGSTIGVTVVHSWGELEGAIETAGHFGDRVLIERYIPGRELAVGVLGDRALPAVEIEPTRDVYDYQCKYTKGMSRYTCPARLDESVALKVEEAALTAFRVLGCADFARVDVRLTPDGHPYVLEVNTIPGMTETSLLPMAARAAGMSYGELVERMCELALARRRRPGRRPQSGAPAAGDPDASLPASSRTG